MSNVTLWIPWAICALIVLSVVHELGTGRSRVRGLGVFLRAAQPGRYWAAIGLKTALAALIAVVARLGYLR